MNKSSQPYNNQIRLSNQTLTNAFKMTNMRMKNIIAATSKSFFTLNL